MLICRPFPKMQWLLWWILKRMHASYSQACLFIATSYSNLQWKLSNYDFIRDKIFQIFGAKSKFLYSYTYLLGSWPMQVN